MTQQEPCKDCGSRDTCKEVYRQVGHSPAPPATKPVIVAFLIPLLVFIASFAAAERFLWAVTAHAAWATGLAAGIGLALAAVAVAIGKVWMGRSSHGKDGRSMGTG